MRMETARSGRAHPSSQGFARTRGADRRSTIGVIQTIPCLALLAAMIPLPFLGLGTRSAVAALFLYVLRPSDVAPDLTTGTQSREPGAAASSISGTLQNLTLGRP